MSGDGARLRLSIVGVVVVSLFSALFARLWYLQVMDTSEFQALATQNQIRIVYEAAPRGRILDRKGRPLVENRGYQAITVTRKDVEDRPDVVTRLAALLAIPREELEKRIADKRYSPYKPVPVAENVSEDLVVYLREHATDFPGVDFEEIGVRRHVRGNLAPHVLGYLGEISPDELLDPSFADVRPGQLVGRGGVEQQYETFLRGRDGITKQEVNAQGEVQSILGVGDPVPGDDLVLSIDADIQELAQDTLEDAVDQARVSVVDEETGSYVKATAGAVVVMDPNDGHVLAMASYP
ncbi:MAG: penicillin-binding protein 2, partial [Acidimicrobiales bacterium]